MLKSMICIVALVSGLSLVTFAQQKKAIQSMTLRGFVVDAMCAKGMVGKESVMRKAADHTRMCALEEACSAAGYGLFSDGEWHKFDASGDKKAKEMIQKSAREKELAFEVTGTMTGGLFAVRSMKEISLKHPGKEPMKKTGGTPQHTH